MSDSQIQNIISNITMSALEIYKKKLEKKKDFSISKILDLLYDDKILTSVVNLFGELTLEDIQRRDTTKSMLYKSKIFSQYDEELAMTYLVQLMSMKKAILKKMREAYSEKSRLYGRELNFNKSDNEYEKSNKVLNVYKLVLLEGLKYLINRRENIVLALRDKMTLLEFTLFQAYKKGF